MFTFVRAEGADSLPPITVSLILHRPFFYDHTKYMTTFIFTSTFIKKNCWSYKSSSLLHMFYSPSLPWLSQRLCYCLCPDGPPEQGLKKGCCLLTRSCKFMFEVMEAPLKFVSIYGHRGPLFLEPILHLFCLHCQNEINSAKTNLVFWSPLKQEIAHLAVDKKVYIPPPSPFQPMHTTWATVPL